jgi:hypothetical protein
MSIPAIAGPTDYEPKDGKQMRQVNVTDRHGNSLLARADYSQPWLVTGHKKAA